MSNKISSSAIDNLIVLFAKLPSLGPRSARRVVLHLIKKREQLMIPLLYAMKETLENVSICQICGNLDTANPCLICCDATRDSKILIVVEDVSDLWALEKANIMKTRYHILGGVLSPLDGIGPDQLSIQSLVNRIIGDEILEVILAVNATIEGQSTAHYLKRILASLDVKVTRLAHGVPIGGELDYLDEGTISEALRSRSSFNFE